MNSTCQEHLYITGLTCWKKPVREFSLTKRNVYDNQVKLERLELINTIQHFAISMLDISKEKKLELVYLLAEKQYYM